MRSSWSLFVSFTLWTSRYNSQSLANMQIAEETLEGRSFIYARNNRGLRTVFCGTPEVTGDSEDAWPSSTTSWVRPSRKSVTQLRMWRNKQMDSLSRHTAAYRLPSACDVIFEWPQACGWTELCRQEANPGSNRSPRGIRYLNSGCCAKLSWTSRLMSLANRFYHCDKILLYLVLRLYLWFLVCFKYYLC